MKKIVLLFLCVICLAGLFSCKANSAKSSGHSGSYAKAISFTDDMGREVTITEEPQNVAVLFSSFAQLWQIAGGEVAITVGESVERGFVSSDILLVDNGAGKTINTELLLASKPDFIIGSADITSHVAGAQLLSELDIPVALFSLESFDDYLRILNILTDITDNKEAYMAKGENLKTEIEALLSSADAEYWQGKKVLFVRAGSTSSSTKAKGQKDHFVCEMLYELGCVNIADKAPILLDGLSMETILSENPDYIFFSLMGNEENALDNVHRLLKDEVWQGLSAVKNGRVVILDRELFHYKPNDRWADAYRYLVELKGFGNET